MNDMTKKDIMYLMEQRNYKFVKYENEKYFFIKQDDYYSKNNIICEVFPNCKFNFVYTNKDMFGVLQSGMLEGIHIEVFFETAEEEFAKSVAMLKKGWNVPWNE